ncbi:MAG: rhodanese-like domain-containing protein [Chloroflexota bacterium]
MPRKHSARKARSQHRRKPFPVFWGLVAAGVVVVLIVVIIILQAPEASPRRISVEEAYRLYQQGAFFLDVREQYEWDAFHIPNTTLIPRGELSARLDEIPRGRPIVVVCRTGNRSQEGRGILLRAGFEDVTSMAGGVTQWQALGYPVVSGP